MKKRTAILIAFCITAGTIGITGSQAGVVAESTQTEAEEITAEFAEIIGAQPLINSKEKSNEIF